MLLTVKNLLDIIESRYGKPENFVSNVRVLLAEHGITQTALAREIGCTLAQVNRWLNGHGRMSLKSMLVVDEALERLLASKAPTGVLFPTQEIQS